MKENKINQIEFFIGQIFVAVAILYYNKPQA